MVNNTQFLTNERLRKKFPNSFDLANYAHMIAVQKLEGGEELPKLNQLISYLEHLPDIEEVKDIEQA